MKRIIRLGILISGSGSTMEDIIKATAPNGQLSNRMIPAVVIASRSGIAGIIKAQKLGVPVFTVERKKFGIDITADMDFGQEINNILEKYGVDWISQNGWLPMTPEVVIQKYNHRIVNQHPGPLDPEHPGKDGKPRHFGGRGMHGKAVAAAVIKFIQLSGRNIPDEATIHFVVPGCDMGKVVARAFIPVQKDDTPETLSARLLPVEHELQIDFWGKVYQGNVKELIRPEPLVNPEENSLLQQAKEYAIKMYPQG